MDQNNDTKKEKNEKTKEAFANAFKKASDIGKKAAEGAKSLAAQTRQNIYDKQAKKYTTVTEEEFFDESFQKPTLIKITDDFANREFVVAEDAVGWIEKCEDVPVLHMYSNFVAKSNITFIPVAQRDGVYCADNFDSFKYINANQVFGKATQEKLAELNHIAYCLGAKSCSIEIMELDSDVDSRSAQLRIDGKNIGNVGFSNSYSKKQSGKTVSKFEGHDNPQIPNLKWFAHDDNIKGLIEMRCNLSIKSTSLELKGSSSATMSKNIACAIDEILGIKGGLSMTRQAIQEYSNSLLFEIEF